MIDHGLLLENSHHLFNSPTSVGEVKFNTTLISRLLDLVKSNSRKRSARKLLSTSDTNSEEDENLH